jgi:orotate phosphoribosyltransferase
MKLLAQKLLQIKAIKLSPQNPFTWASGILSPIYCDNRVTLSYPDVRNYIKQQFVEKSTAFGDFDVVAGVATAGIPHGMLLADALNKPFIYVRDKPKGHGRQNQIEGEVAANAKVLVVEDLISTGGSSIKAVQILQEIGCEVVGTVAIFTYGFDVATTTFEAANCPLLTLCNYDTLIEVAAETGYVNPSDLEMLKDWRKGK